MDEEISLTRPGVNAMAGRSKAIIFWWGVNIFIVVFVFLAFLFSTLSYAHGVSLATEVQNSFYNQQGGLIQQTYRVADSYSVKQGAVASFCGDAVCEGLGPVWGMPFETTGTATAAVLASIARLTESLSVYVFVVDSDHTLMRASIVQTDATPRIRGTFTYNVTEAVTTITALNTNDASTFVVYYTTATAGYLIAGTINTNTITFYSPIRAYTVNVTESALRTDAATLDSWILVTYGYEGEGCTHTAYTVDSTASSRLRALPLLGGVFNTLAVGLISTAYIGYGYFVQANAYSFRMGQVDFTNYQLKSLQLVDVPHHFASLTITPVYNQLLLFTGVQTMFIDEPITLAFIAEWSSTTPYLTVYRPENLLSTQQHTPLRDQLSVCYMPPYDQEPYGGIFLSYIDGYSLMAKIIRGRIAEVNGHPTLLPSVALDISTFKSGKYNSWIQPLLVCPVLANHAAIAFQDRTTVFNTFKWAGGVRYAGIPQADRNAKESVDVIRQGISSGHTGLISGYHYYVFNNGSLAPYSSTAELFTNTGFPWYVGTAISSTQLFIEENIFDYFG